MKALVTGGEGGLGRAFRARLEREGYQVESLDISTGFDVTDPPADASVSFTVYPAITSRNQYNTAAQGAPLTSVLGQVSVPLASLGTGPDGSRTLALGLQSTTDARDPGKLNVRRPGVYPVDVELRDADGRLTSFSVQYHPEAAAGPHDAAYLFDRFADLMAERRLDTPLVPRGYSTNDDGTGA